MSDWLDQCEDCGGVIWGLGGDAPDYLDNPKVCWDCQYAPMEADELLDEEEDR